MPCEPIIEKGKVIGWICRRSRERPKPPPCYKCGKPSTKLCDFRDYGTRTGTDNHGREKISEWGSIYTCDKPMCDVCTNHIGEDTDFCDDHANELAMLRTAQGERVYNEQLKRLGIDEEDMGT